MSVRGVERLADAEVGPSLNAYHDIQSLFGAPPRDPDCRVLPVECLLVIDSGYSHTTVTPLYNGRPIQQAIRRLKIGGKFMTNFFKELATIRYYNMSDETFLINEIKEAVSYVSENFRQDLERTRKGFKSRNKDEAELRIDYVLPDYNAHKQGFVRPHDPSLSVKMRKLGSLATAGGVVEDFMTLGNERFTVPELLFNPGDVGLKQAGLPELVLQSLSGVPTGLWPAMLANIFVVGGNSKITGFMERLWVSIVEYSRDTNKAQRNRDPPTCTCRVRSPACQSPRVSIRLTTLECGIQTDRIQSKKIDMARWVLPCS